MVGMPLRVVIPGFEHKTGLNQVGPPRVRVSDIVDQECHYSHRFATFDTFRR